VTSSLLAIVARPGGVARPWRDLGGPGYDRGGEAALRHRVHMAAGRSH